MLFSILVTSLSSEVGIETVFTWCPDTVVISILNRCKPEVNLRIGDLVALGKLKFALAQSKQDSVHISARLDVCVSPTQTQRNIC